jgi:hypothetical protein
MLVARCRMMEPSERRTMARHASKVVHNHRIGSRVILRVSELVFVNGRPQAILEWLDLGGVRTPLYVEGLDPSKLRVLRRLRRTYFYEGTTTDPRFDLGPQAPEPKRPGAA